VRIKLNEVLESGLVLASERDERDPGCSIYGHYPTRLMVACRISQSPKPRKDFLAHSTVEKPTLPSCLRRFREVRIRISGNFIGCPCRNKKQISVHFASGHIAKLCRNAKFRRHRGMPDVVGLAVGSNESRMAQTETFPRSQ
jgi:hypothetical protein